MPSQVLRVADTRTHTREPTHTHTRVPTLIEQRKDGAVKGLDSTLLASGLVGSVLYMAARWSLDGCKKPVEDVVENAMLIFRGVGMLLTE